MIMIEYKMNLLCGGKIKMLNNVTQLVQKNDITEFGFQSHSHVVQIGNEYRLVQYAYNRPLIQSHELKNFMGLDVYTMYTGSDYATGDYILEAEMPDGNIEHIYTFK